MMPERTTEGKGGIIVGKFERSMEDGSPLRWEYQETYDVFNTWYWRTMRTPFIVWWVVTGLFSAVFLFVCGRDVSLIDDAMHNGQHGIMFFTTWVLLFIVPIFVCPVLSYAIVNKVHRNRLDESLKRTFGDNEDARECLNQIRRSIPFS
jgi:hypothetical protein